MEMIDYVLIAVIAAIVGLAAWYIFKTKKNGKKCIGCPDSAHCSGCCGSCDGCSKTKLEK